ncbi:MAG: NAD(P)/FAD-dependent oxidoreductase [Bosea sp. (in: a-proteobacteria)]
MSADPAIAKAGFADQDFGLWGATAEPAPLTEALPGDRDADVAIVGAGYTGLSTALHLADLGISAICIDSQGPGFGASGRNGGQVLPGFKLYPDQLIAKYGEVRGRAMAAFGAGIADMLFALVGRHGIACDARQTGWVHAGHHVSKLAEQRWKHDQWASRGANVQWLDRVAIAQEVGSQVYEGGWLDRRAGTVQPLSFARGLARVAMAKGAVIHSGTRANCLQRKGDGWRISTSKGTIRARHVVLATNGYTGRLLPKLAGTIVPMDSAQIATAPLSEAQRATILPEVACVSDTRRSLLYFRSTADGRLVMGGRGGILSLTNVSHFARLERATHLTFPALAGISFTHRWAGTLAVTMDHMPHLHEPEAGLIVSLGCNGRGVAYSTAMGEVIAQRIARGTWDGAPMPVTPVTPMPFAPFRRIGAAAVATWYGWRDKWQGAL